MIEAEPTPGTEYEVKARRAFCAHCTLLIQRTGDDWWRHINSHKRECAELNVKLADIRAERAEGK